MSDTVPKITPKLVAQRLSQLVLDAPSGPPPAESPYVQAAAVVASFVPEQLQPIGSGPDPDGVAAPLRVSEPVYGASGRQEWRLPDAIRRETLRQLHDQGTLRQLVAANPNHEGGPVQQMLSAYATESAPPLDAQSYDELLATAKVITWLHGVVPGVPDLDEVRGYLERAEMLAPLRALVGSFRGRTNILEQLHDYTDVLPPNSAGAAVKRGLRRVLSLAQHPPLLLHGPGGVGKSTVLAKFVLDHTDVDDELRIPFVYVDCDRPGMLPQEPLTLLVEALRQLGVQHPEAQDEIEHLRAKWLKRLAEPDFRLLASAVVDPLQLTNRSVDVPEGLLLRSSIVGRERFYEEFAGIVREVVPRKPLLFALDTFEIVQRYGPDIVHEVWELLEGLQRALPSLRVVLSGRAPIEGHRTRPVKLDGFDTESARGFLASLMGEELGADTELINHIVRTVGRNPLSLRLAADLVINHGRKDIDDIDKRRLIKVRVRTEQVQGWLYRRILDRILDENVRNLAYPGLVVRRLTPGVIRHVLAGPCRVDVPDDARAQELFDACSREVSLLSWTTDGSLEHRSDIRREMLPILRHNEPDRVLAIHLGAVRHYQQFKDLTSRAEELYHRLCLGEPASRLDERWDRGVENLLGRSLDEFPAASQIYLASKLGITLPPNILEDATLREWERHTATRVRGLLRYDEPEAALAVLNERSDRTAGSPLDILEARAFEELGDLERASAVLDRASQRAADAGKDDTLLDLQYAAARLAERRGRTKHALRLLDSARVLAREGKDRLMPLRLDVAELRLRTASVVASPEASSVHDRLLQLLDSIPVEDVAQDPVLLTELTAVAGRDRPALVTQALLTVGLGDLTEEQVKELAAALATWDDRNDGRLAARIGLRLGDDEDPVGAWARWLRGAPTEVAKRLVLLVTEFQQPEPVVGVVSKLYRTSLAAGR